MTTRIFDWLRRLWRPKVEAGLKPGIVPCVMNASGELVPVGGWPAERMMSRREAEAWLDENAFSWRRFGEPPGRGVDGKILYVESDLVRWLQDDV